MSETMTDREPAPAVSVVIPHLEDAEGLERCLAALTAQAGAPPFEVIVVDNGSADPPAALVEAAGARLAREGTPGPGPARSHGASLARAPVLAFLDSDCIAAPDWIAVIAREFARGQPPDVIGGDIRIALRNPARGPDGIEAYESVFGYRQALYIRRDGYTATCNMAVRRAVFEAVGPFAGIDRAEDMDWGRRAGALGHRIEYIEDMKIATPARGSFPALARKWDRHIAHDFAKLRGRRDRLRWTLRALMLAASPAGETVRVWRSPRLGSGRGRVRAMAVLTRIRLYRARRMLALLMAGRTEPGGGWRRASRH